MFKKIGLVIALVFVLSSTYTLWKSGVKSEGKAELAKEINQQTETEVLNDKAKLDEVFVNGSDDDAINDAVDRMLPAESSKNSDSGQLRGPEGDSRTASQGNSKGSHELGLQDGSGSSQTTRENPKVAPVLSESKPLSDEELSAAEALINEGCINEVVYLDDGQTKTIKTCPEEE